MSKRILVLAAAALIISSGAFVAGQTTVTTVTPTPTTVTKTIQNADGTYTIIEYPVGKEVQLTLTPVSITGSKAVGTILRDDNGTRVVLNLTDVPAEVSTIHVYAVDDAGVVTLLGPVELANGAGKFTATTPLSKFMLIAAPDAEPDDLRSDCKGLFPQRGAPRLRGHPILNIAGWGNGRRNDDAGNYAGRCIAGCGNSCHNDACNHAGHNVPGCGNSCHNDACNHAGHNVPGCGNSCRDGGCNYTGECLHGADAEYPGLQKGRRHKTEGGLHRRHGWCAREYFH